MALRAAESASELLNSCTGFANESSIISTLSVDEAGFSSELDFYFGRMASGSGRLVATWIGSGKSVLFYNSTSSCEAAKLALSTFGTPSSSDNLVTAPGCTDEAEDFSIYVSSSSFAWLPGTVTGFGVCGFSETTGSLVSSGADSAPLSACRSCPALLLESDLIFLAPFFGFGSGTALMFCSTTTFNFSAVSSASSSD